MYIIGYIHICQRGNWQRSFSMLINAIKSSQLYSNVNTIRIGVVNDSGKIITDPLLNDSKFDIIYLGRSAQYERPTLLHMRAKAETDPSDTVYFYLHTKGIKHFGTKKELNVVSWINLMLYWNIIRWRYATEVLKTYNAYGCDYIYVHFSGNFWWATAKHIKKLPTYIENFYVAPECWVTIVKEKVYSAYCSEYAGGGLYYNYLAPDKYNKLSNSEAYMTNKRAFNEKTRKSPIMSINNVSHTNNKLNLKTVYNEKKDMGANMMGANMMGANMMGANMMGANNMGANNMGANNMGANNMDKNKMDAIKLYNSHNSTSSTMSKINKLTKSIKPPIINNDTKVNNTKVNNTKVNNTKVNSATLNNIKINNIKINNIKINNTKINNIKQNNTKVNNKFTLSNLMG